MRYQALTITLCLTNHPRDFVFGRSDIKPTVLYFITPTYRSLNDGVDLIHILSWLHPSNVRFVQQYL